METLQESEVATVNHTTEEPVILHTDHSAIKDAKRSYSKLIPLLTRVLKEFKRIGIGEISTEDQLRLLIRKGATGYLNDRLYEFAGGEEKLLLGSIPIKREKLAEMLSIGDVNPFYHAVSEAVRELEKNGDMNYVGITDGEAVLKEAEFSADLEEKFSLKLTTPGQREAYRKATNMLNSINEWNEMISASKLNGLKLTQNTFRQIFVDLTGITGKQAPPLKIQLSVLRAIAGLR